MQGEDVTFPVVSLVDIAGPVLRGTGRVAGRQTHMDQCEYVWSLSVLVEWVCSKVQPHTCK